MQEPSVSLRQQPTCSLRGLLHKRMSSKEPSLLRFLDMWKMQDKAAAGSLCITTTEFQDLAHVGKRHRYRRASPQLITEPLWTSILLQCPQAGRWHFESALCSLQDGEAATPSHSTSTAGKTAPSPVTVERLLSSRLSGNSSFGGSKSNCPPKYRQ